MTSDVWSLGSSKCPHCSSLRLTKFEAIAHDGRLGDRVAIAECVNCQLAWQAGPARSAAESVAHFERAYRPTLSEPSGYFATEHKAGIVSLELDFLATLIAAGKRLIDIGGGSGAFAVAAARRGWVASAVDPALDIGSLENSAVQGYRGLLSQVPNSEQFDIATIWDVIEHVEEPFEFLLDIRKRLCSGGFLVLSTGNYKSVDRLSAGKQHWMYQLDHRWYFSPESIGRLLSLTGFEVVDSCKRVLRPGWSGGEFHEGPTVRSLLTGILKNPINVMDVVGRFNSLRKARLWPQSGLVIFKIIARVT